MTYIRTDEHRRQSAQRIEQTKPWLNTTGPKTIDGERRSSQNVYKRAVHPTLHALSKTLNEHVAQLDSVKSKKLGKPRY